MQTQHVSFLIGFRQHFLKSVGESYRSRIFHFPHTQQLFCLFHENFFKEETYTQGYHLAWEWLVFFPP